MKKPQSGPSLSKATYDAKRAPKDPPSPARKQAELAEKIREAEKSRGFHRQVTKVGLGKALFPDIDFPTKEPIKRRI